MAPKLLFGGGATGKPVGVTAASALRKLSNLENTYLYVVRPVRPEVAKHILNTVVGGAAYDSLRENRTRAQIVVGVLCGAVALALVLGAIWLGMWLANRFVAPVEQLIGAAQEVAHGNLNVRVAVGREMGDFAQLGWVFNKLVSQHRGQGPEHRRESDR